MTQVEEKLAAEAAAPNEPYWAMVHRLFKEMDTPALTLVHAAIGMTGECGEIVLAHCNGDAKNMLEELGDFRFYFQKLLQTFGWSLNEFTLAGNDKYMPNFEHGPMNALVIATCDVQDLLKKQWVYNKLLDGKAFYVLVGKLANAYHTFISTWGFSDLEIRDANQYKLSTGPNARYPLGYSDAAAIARADKVGEEKDRPMERTQFEHVWKDTATGKFHFSDEAEQIGTTPYDTDVDANTALGHYCEHVLGDKREQQVIEPGCVGNLDAVIGEVRPCEVTTSLPGGRDGLDVN